MKKTNYFVLLTAIAGVVLATNQLNIVTQLGITMIVVLITSLLLNLLKINKSDSNGVMQLKNVKISSNYKGKTKDKDIRIDSWVGEQLEQIHKQRLKLKTCELPSMVSAAEVFSISKSYDSIEIGSIIKLNGECFYVKEGMQNFTPDNKRPIKGYRLPDNLQEYFAHIS